MGNVFRVRPVRVKRVNGQVLTPDMEITVTTQSYTSDPFYNGAKQIQEQYMRMYQFDYKKSNCSKYDFEFIKIGQYFQTKVCASPIWLHTFLSVSYSLILLCSTYFEYSTDGVNGSELLTTFVNPVHDITFFAYQLQICPPL